MRLKQLLQKYAGKKPQNAENISDDLTEEQTVNCSPKTFSEDSCEYPEEVTEDKIF
ncbi:MAG: hypothetical protein M0022_08220 [Desulfobacteraceae bacterium]|nr:hypothetical protein [Desulfobacteraceae bacterium]